MIDTGRGGGRPAGRPLRVGVLSSARAPGLDRLLERSGRPDPLYRVVGVVASDPGGEALGAARRAGVPAVAHELRPFLRAAGPDATQWEIRRRYDRVTVELLRAVGTELVVMCGYLLVASDVLLDAFPERVVNVHDADLTLTDGRGVPVYRGLRSTRDAVFAGEPETRSTVHLATSRVDEGPPLVRSRSFPVPGKARLARRRRSEGLLKACAYAQREWMMQSCWGVLLDRTVELFALGRIRFVGDRAVVDGDFGPEDVDERLARDPAGAEPPAERPAGPGARGAGP